uniref:Uncharacterized protein LOC105650801 n=1 Tax=Rhizophora mucronata TaxID=61149 RepID=A0A2P2LPG7_RHIMU
MSSISQSLLMALTVTFNKYTSSNVHAVHRREANRVPTRNTPEATELGRRGILLSIVVGAHSVSDSRTGLLQSNAVPFFFYYCYHCYYLLVWSDPTIFEILLQSI